VPPGHAEQLPGVPLYPMLHKQAVFATFGAEFAAHRVQSPVTTDPAGEIESVPQLVHTTFPGAGLYVPAAHCKQLSDSKVYPMLHKQTVLVVSGADFTAHCVQADTVVDARGEMRSALH